jgi:hypothetical protein
MFSTKIHATYKYLHDIMEDFKTIAREHPAVGFMINSKVKRFYTKNLKSITTLEAKRNELAEKHFVVDRYGQPKMLKDFQGNPKGFIHKNIDDKSGYDRELIQFLKTPVTIYE